GRVAPAAVRAFEGAEVGLDRSRVLVSAEDDARQDALAAELSDLLAHHLAGSDIELLGFSQDGTPLTNACEAQVSQGGVGKSKTRRTGEPSVRSVGHCSLARPTPQVITRSKSSTSRTSLMSGVVVGFSDVAPV